MKDTYTKALLQLWSEDDASSVLPGFKKVLKNRGHEQLFVPVLRSVLRELEARRPTTSVVVGSEADSKNFEAEIKNTLKDLGSDTTPDFIVDESLIGGYVAEHDHVRTDASYKTKLVSLYRSFTK